MLADLQALVMDLVRDAAGQVSTDQRDTAIALAVAKYSADRPRDAVAAGVSTDGLRLPLPDPWAEGMDVAWIEYPVDAIPPAQVRHIVHRGLAGLEILLGENIGAGSTAHVHYTQLHALSDSIDTIPVVHREAVGAYAAAWLFEQLAGSAAGNTDSTIQADSVDHKSQAAEYAARARTLRKRYADVVVVADAAETRPASAAVSWPGRKRFPGLGAR
jgi:hypothetical protein